MSREEWWYRQDFQSLISCLPATNDDSVIDSVQKVRSRLWLSLTFENDVVIVVVVVPFEKISSSWIGAGSGIDIIKFFFECWDEETGTEIESIPTDAQCGTVHPVTIHGKHAHSRLIGDFIDANERSNRCCTHWINYTNQLEKMLIWTWNYKIINT